MTSIHTDGAYSPAKNVGGWGVLIDHDNGGTAEIAYGRVRNTTNNRMEMVAIIRGLTGCEDDEFVNVYTDSELIVKCVEGEYEISKNLDLWQDLHDQVERLTGVDFHHQPRNSTPQLAEADRLSKLMTSDEARVEWSQYGAALDEGTPESVLKAVTSGQEPVGQDDEAGVDSQEPSDGVQRTDDAGISEGEVEDDEPTDPATPTKTEKKPARKRAPRKRKKVTRKKTAIEA